MITNGSDLSFLLKHFILHFIKLLYMARYYGRDVFVLKNNDVICLEMKILLPSQ